MIIGLYVLARAAGFAAALLGAPEPAEHPNALWRVVHDLCVRDARLTGLPAPCLKVDLRAGVAVVPDPKRRTQVLLTPTRASRGIEDPLLLRPGGTNYWQAAWDARRFVAQRAGREIDRQDVALAINSAASRSQNQLHIHVDCMRPDVRAELDARLGEIGPAWRRLRAPLAGRFYRARRLDGAELGPRDPFRLLARGDAQARRAMARQSLAVVPVDWPGRVPGFVLLAERGDGAFAEALLDHACTILDAPAPAVAALSDPPDPATAWPRR